MNSQPKTPRERAEAICKPWYGVTGIGAIEDAIVAALEEDDRERDQLRVLARELDGPVLAADPNAANITIDMVVTERLIQHLQERVETNAHDTLGILAYLVVKSAKTLIEKEQ